MLGATPLPDWDAILAAALFAGLLGAAGIMTLGGERRGRGLLVAAIATAGGTGAALGVVRSADAQALADELDLALLPLSWMDVNAGLWSLAAVTLARGLTSRREARARQLALVATLCGLAGLAMSTAFT